MEPKTTPDAPLSLDELGNTLWTTLLEWADYAVRMLPNLVLAMVVLGLGLLAARVIASVTDRGLRRVSTNVQVNSLLTVTTRVAVMLLAVFGALAVMRLDGVVTSMLAGVGVIGLALGFAFQDIAANFMSGVLMAISRPFKVGDVVKTSEYSGTVEQVDLRATALRTFTGERVLIPNKDVFNKAIMNYTDTAARRVDLKVGVGYGDDLPEVRKVLRAALEGLEFRHPDKDVEVYFDGFGDSSIDVSVRVWLPMGTATNFLEARTLTVIAVKQALTDAGMNIPFPIRTLDFGAAPVGGERLDVALRPVFGEAAEAK